MKAVATVKSGDFEWDASKAATNEIKHGVSFEEAVTAFFDERYLAVEDPQGHADRFVLIGMSKEARILYVVHAEIVNVRRTRIISARLANKREALKYAMGDAP
jgi:uncharacterized DUF497 family protein